MLILYPQVRNSMTQLMVSSILQKKPTRLCTLESGFIEIRGVRLFQVVRLFRTLEYVLPDFDYSLFFLGVPF